MSEAGFYTASICARLCLRRHAHADTPEAAMDAARTALVSAARAAADVAHASGCEVEVNCDYQVAYPSVEPAP